MELLQRQIKWGGARGSEAKSKAGRPRWGSEQQAPLTSSFLGTEALSFCFSLKSCLHSGLGPKVTEALCLPIVRAGGTNKGLPPRDCGMFIILKKSLCRVSQEILPSYLRTGPEIGSHHCFQRSTGPLGDMPVGTPLRW